jgi:hypothetical protein
VEEASAASKAMEQQSAELVTQIGYFRSDVQISDVRAPQAASRPRPKAVGPTGKQPAKAPVRQIAQKKTAAASPAPLARAAGDDSSWQEF